MIGSESPARVLTVAEAKVVEADPEAYRLPLEAARRRKFVVLSRVGEDGLRTVIARVAAGDALCVDAVVDPGVLLQHPGEYFPYATTTTPTAEMDHVTPYDQNRPPDQTSTDNLGPLTRHRHRVKTHGGYQAIQTGLGEYLSRTPHGLYFLVDHTGTHPAPDHLGDLTFALHTAVDEAA